MPAPPSFVVRRATAEDLSGVLAVQRASGRRADDRFRAATADAVSDPARCVVVATIDHVVAGWAITHHHPAPDGPAPAGHYLMGIAVAPVHRGRGIATALTAARLEWIRDRDTTAHFVTNARNAASIALHAAFGFTEIARAAAFHGVRFDGGEGILFSARLA